MLNSSECGSTQVSVKFQLLIKHCKNLKTVLAFKLSDAVFILLINVKMSTIYEQDKFHADLHKNKNKKTLMCCVS